MAASPGSTITEHFATLTDPRVERTKEHHLLDLLTIALCAIISGADEWVAMEAYGKAKREWFDTFLARYLRAGLRCARSRPIPSLLPRLGAVRHRPD
jgi:hypothetical protein